MTSADARVVLCLWTEEPTTFGAVATSAQKKTARSITMSNPRLGPVDSTVVIRQKAVFDSRAADLCDSCELSASLPPHTCPYAEEIHGDEKLCNCCNSCTHQCAMDI